MAHESAEKTTEKSTLSDEVQGLLANARKRIQGLEKDLLERGRAQQKELEALLKGVRDGKQLKALEKQAVELSEEVRKRADEVQGKVLVALGVATRSEIEEIHAQLTKLSKTVEELITKKSGPAA